MSVRVDNVTPGLATVLAMGLAGWSSWVGAQPLTMAARQLDPVVVTGTRTERLQRESPVRTEVVDAEEIERYHSTTLEEALRYVPGLQLREIHGKSGYEVWLQGMSANRVLVLVDGLPVSPTSGSSVDVSQLALLDIERIEVVKGAASAQYGSAAMGGVVNLITRPIDQGLAVEVTLDGGTYGDQNGNGDPSSLGTQHGQVKGSLGGEQWRVRLSADENRNDGIDPDPDTWPMPGNPLTYQTLSGRLEFHGLDGRSRAYVQGSEFTEDSEARFYADSNADNQAERHIKWESLTRTRVSAGAQWASAAGSVLALDGVVEVQDDLTRKENLSAGYDYDERDSEYQIERYTSRFELPEWGGHGLMAGLDYSREELRQTKDGASELKLENGSEDASRFGPELFLQDDWFLTERWELLLGARYQEDSDFGEHVSPKVSVRYQWLEGPRHDLFVRASWANGYRVPNLKERYYIFDHSQLGYMIEGNANLQPESSTGWQLGLGWLFNEQLSLDLNGFYSRYEDLIQVDYARFENSVVIYEYQNLERAMTRGLELTAQWLASDALTLNAGYSFLETEDLDTGLELPRRPEHQYTAGLDWQVASPLMLSALVRGQSDEYVDGSNTQLSPEWAVLDLKLNFDWLPAVRLFGGVENVFNKQRDFTQAGTDFGPVAGRYVYAGVRWQLTD